MNGYLLVALVLAATNFNLCSGYPWKASKPKKPEPPTLCYDCDYDPDDAQVDKDDKPTWSANGYGKASDSGGGSQSEDGRRGFPRCALDSGDERFVRLTECHFNVCFIRRDHNGLVYRGCADPRNLPLGVDSSLQCREQGPLPAVWWFCNGTLCNSEQFSTACSADSSKGGKSGLSSCDPHPAGGYPPPSVQASSVANPPGYSSSLQTFQPLPPQPPTAQKHTIPSYPPPPPPSPAEPPSAYAGPSSVPAAPWSYDKQEKPEQSGYQSEADDDDEPAYRTWDFLLLAKSRLQRLDDTSADWASSDSQDWTSTNNADRTASTNSEDWSAAAEDNTGQGYYNHHDDDSQKKPSDEVAENPCDHKCVDNPSALFADPSRPDGFIQCGPGVNYEIGFVCHCCLPYRLTCPSGAHFDPVAKICTNGKTLDAANENKNANKPGVYEHVH